MNANLQETVEQHIKEAIDTFIQEVDAIAKFWKGYAHLSQSTSLGKSAAQKIDQQFVPDSLKETISTSLNDWLNASGDAERKTALDRLASTGANFLTLALAAAASQDKSEQATSRIFGKLALNIFFAGTGPEWGSAAIYYSLAQVWEFIETQNNSLNEKKLSLQKAHTGYKIAAGIQVMNEEKWRLVLANAALPLDDDTIDTARADAGRVAINLGLLETKDGKRILTEEQAVSAAAYYQHAIDLGQSSGNFYLAQLYYQQSGARAENRTAQSYDKLAQALGHCDNYLKQEPDSKNALILRLAILLANTGSKAEAIIETAGKVADLRLQRDTNPEDAAYIRNMTIGAYQAIIEDNRTDTDAHKHVGKLLVERAKALCKTKDVTGAADDYRAAIAAGHVAANMPLAKILLDQYNDPKEGKNKIQHLNDAITYCKAYIVAYPYDTKAKALLGTLHKTQRTAQKAVVYEAKNYKDAQTLIRNSIISGFWNNKQNKATRTAGEKPNASNADKLAYVTILNELAASLRLGKNASLRKAGDNPDHITLNSVWDAKIVEYNNLATTQKVAVAADEHEYQLADASQKSKEIIAALAAHLQQQGKLNESFTQAIELIDEAGSMFEAAETTEVVAAAITQIQAAKETFEAYYQAYPHNKGALPALINAHENLALFWETIVEAYQDSIEENPDSDNASAWQAEKSHAIEQALIHITQANNLAPTAEASEALIIKHQKVSRTDRKSSLTSAVSSSESQNTEIRSRIENIINEWLAASNVTVRHASGDTLNNAATTALWNSVKTIDGDKAKINQKALSKVIELYATGLLDLKAFNPSGHAWGESGAKQFKHLLFLISKEDSFGKLLKKKIENPGDMFLRLAAIRLYAEHQDVVSENLRNKVKPAALAITRLPIKSNMGGKESVARTLAAGAADDALASFANEGARQSLISRAAKLFQKKFTP